MTQDGVQLTQLDSIQDFEITFKLEKKQEGYLGETSDRYDETFHGIDGSFTIHMTTGTVYDMVQAIIDRARRRVPGTKFAVKSSLRFPDGERKRIVIDDIFFGNLPNAFPKRDDYVNLKLDFSASSGRFI